MKKYNIIYQAIVDRPDDPDEGYYKLYPKEGGYYSLDSDGNEVRLEGIVIIDDEDQVLDQKPKLKFDYPFKTVVDDDTIVVSFEGSDEDDDFTFMHDNEFHSTNYATEAALQTHIDNDNDAHGLDISEINTLKHTQNTDTILDQGGDNEVSAAQIKALVGQLAVRGLLKTSDAETNVTTAYQTYIAETSDNNVSFILPAASDFSGETVRFRKANDENAMTIHRSGDDNIVFDDSSETLLTFEDKSDRVDLQSDGDNWHVV